MKLNQIVVNGGYGNGEETITKKSAKKATKTEHNNGEDKTHNI